MTAPDYIVQRERRWDFLKGVMLLILSAGHIKGFFPAFQRYTDQLWAPFGYFSMAEGFLFLSAIITGISLTRKSDEEARKRTIYDRTIRIYFFQVLLIIVVFFSVLNGAQLEQLQSFRNDPEFYTLLSVLLVYCAPLLDILPLYIFFLPLSLLLLRGFRSTPGTIVVFVLSILSWWLSQSFHPWGSDYFNIVKTFSPFAWQILFVFGFWIGAIYIPQVRLVRFPRILPFLFYGTCFAGAVYCWGVRHHFFDNQFFPDISVYYDRRFALPAFCLVNFLLFCGALRLVGSFNYGSWPLFRFVGRWYGRESLVVFSWSVLAYYMLLGMGYHARTHTAGEQFGVFSLLVFGGIVPAGVVKLLKWSRRGAKTA